MEARLMYWSGWMGSGMGSPLLSALLIDGISWSPPSSRYTVGLKAGQPIRDCLPRQGNMSCRIGSEKKMAAIIRQQPIRVGSGAGEVGSTAPTTDEPKFCACANFKKFSKNKFLGILTFAATLQCITLVATTLLINETLNNLDKTTTPFSRPMTSMTMGVSRPGNGRVC